MRDQVRPIRWKCFHDVFENLQCNLLVGFVIQKFADEVNQIKWLADFFQVHRLQRGSDVSASLRGLKQAADLIEVFKDPVGLLLHECQVLITGFADFSRLLPVLG